MYMGNYDIAQICENGHVITPQAGKHEDRRQEYCEECGASTVMACSSCKDPIRGVHYKYEPFQDYFDPYKRPAFCHNCGNSFPWTEAKLCAAKNLADELENLTDGERESLKKSLPDLIRETPQTPLAETRFKKIMRKVEKSGFELMRLTLKDVVSEGIRNSLFGQ